MQGPRFLRTLSFATVILTLAGSAFAAEKVGIETGLHDGYGRIVFAWPEPIKFEAALSDKGARRNRHRTKPSQPGELPPSRRSLRRRRQPKW